MAHATAEICLGGNVLLLLHDNSRLLVDAHTLARGSKVFAAMFSEHYREGTALLRNAEGGPPIEIPLPDDDVECLNIICSVMHLRNDNVELFEKAMDPDKIMQIAEVVDKYDCAIGVRAALHCWLGVHMQTNSTPTSTNLTLLAASHLLQDAQAFRHFGKLLVKRSVNNLEHGIDMDRVRVVIDWLERQRQKTKRLALLYVEGAMLKFSQDCRKCEEDEPEVFPSARIAAAALYEQLAEAKLWPCKAAMAKETVETIIKAMKEFDLDWPDAEDEASANGSVDAPYPGEKATMLDLGICGPCLPCYKTTGDPMVEGCDHKNLKRECSVHDIRILTKAPRQGA